MPLDLRARIHRREWKFSLRGREPRLAKLLCLKATLAIERVHHTARAMPQLTNDQIVSLARKYLDWALSSAAETTMTLSRGRVDVQDLPDFNGSGVDVVAVSHAKDPAWVNDEVAQIKAAAEDLRARSISRDYDWATKVFANDLLAEAGIDGSKLDEGHMDQLLHMLLRARAEEKRILYAQMTGAYEDTQVKDPIFKGLSLPSVPRWHEPSVKPADAMPTLSAAIERFVGENTGTEWVRKTLLDQLRVLRWFQELTSPTITIDKITKADVRAFKDALFVMPKNYRKLALFKDKQLPQVLALAKDRPDIPRLSQAARAKYFTKLKAFLKWCEDEYDVLTAARSMSVPEPDDAQDRRDPFSKEQLEALFSSPLYTGHGIKRHTPGKMLKRDGMFWAPLICICTGMRLGEVAQLCVPDIKLIEGVWCIDNSDVVQPSDGPPKQFKTKTSRRVIPIHPELLKLGFIEMVESRRGSTASNRVFPEIKCGSQGEWSANISKVLNRYLRYTGIWTPKSVMHSFRHNFADACEHAPQVKYLTKKALMGHSDKSVTDLYGNKPSPKRLYEEGIAHISFGVDLSHIGSLPGQVSAVS